MKAGARIAAMERMAGSRMIVAKLGAGVDLNSFLSSGIEQRASDLVVRIVRPESVGSDWAKVVVA